MKTEFFISWRYLVTKRKEKFISLISIISILGVAIGVMALIVVLGVMTGFDQDLRDKIIGNYSHISITNFEGIDDGGYDQIIRKIASNPHIRGISPNVSGQVLIKQGNKFFALGLRGINPYTEPQVTNIKKYLVCGDLNEILRRPDRSVGAPQDDPDKCRGQVIIGKELASNFGLTLNSNVSIFSPAGKEHKLRVSGIFNSGMYDYDLNLVITDLKTSQNILGMDNQITSVNLKLDSLFSADRVRDELAGILGPDYNLKTWQELNQNFFAALRLEKLTMFIILTLIILVASFNIISTLIVLVVDKTKDIGILKAIGMNSRQISRIFTYEGMIIGGLGTSLGAAAGMWLCWLLKKYQFIKLPQDIYYIDKLPVCIELWPDIVLVVSAAMIITLISTIYPASKAARLNTVEALRYE